MSWRGISKVNWRLICKISGRLKGVGRAMSNHEVIGVAILMFFIGISTSAVIGDIRQVFFGIPTDIATKYFAALMVAVGFAIWETYYYWCDLRSPHQHTSYVHLYTHVQTPNILLSISSPCRTRSASVRYSIILVPLQLLGHFLVDP